MLVSIVVPCYNSENTIEKLCDLCMETFSKLDGYDCEMILVNDFSKDNTISAIRRAAAKYPNVTGVDLAKNFGQHAALMAAFEFVNGELVIGMDDDLQNHPDQIPMFLEKADEGYDVIFAKYKKQKSSFFKSLTRKGADFFMWRLLDRPKGIEMGNFWLARRYVIERVKEYEGNNAVIQTLFFRTTGRICNIEIEHFDREFGQSNYTFRKGFKLFLSIMNYSVVPLRFATFLGGVLSVIGLISAIVILIMKLVNPNMAVGWPSIMCTLLILFGFMFIILGIIGEYLGKLVLTSSKTPQFVIREEIHGKEGHIGENRSGKRS